jgi:phospholipid/cholesterol/gamma-HCH transport system substrate-binding protein
MMMGKHTKNNIRLGLFVIVALVLFTAGIYFIGQNQRLFSDVIRVSCVFNDVSGLQAGNNVKFAGINIGTVEEVSIITDSSVKVTMVIDEEIRKFIKKDARAGIGSEGLMGNKMISITPGSGGASPIEDNDMITSVHPITFDDILLRLKVTTENAAIITDDLAEITYNIREGKGTIGKLFMDTTLATSLEQTVGNIRRGTKGFEQNMNAAKKSIFLRGGFKDRKTRREERKSAREEKEKEKTK